LTVSNREPSEYLPEIARRNPGALESHWIPTDPDLWEVVNYPRFLEVMRQLLAQAANGFLESLLAGSVPEEEPTVSVLDRKVSIAPSGVVTEDEEALLLECAVWVTEQGLPDGELLYELTDVDTGEPLVVIDLAWPNGLQEGLSNPVALLIDENAEVEQIVNAAGYRFFTDVEDFKTYVRQHILAEAVPTA
jgi:hypothetical protein